MSFTDVVVGNPTQAADINQLIDALNGTVAGAAILLASASNVTPFAANLPSAPGADQPVIRTIVTGDSNPRIAAYVRGSDGYGGIEGGTGTSITAHLYAQAGGWKTAEAFTVGGTLVSASALSGANKALDLQQAYAVWSDNVAGIFGASSTRLWFDAPDLGDMEFGPRSGANTMAGARIRALAVTFDASNTNGHTPGLFSVQGGMAFSFDAGHITSDGAGNLTVNGHVSFDAGHITSDGAGNLTVNSINTGGGSLNVATLTATGNATLEGYIQSLQSGAASGLSFRAWSGSASVVPLSIGAQYNSAPSWFDASGSLFLTGAAATYGLLSSLQSGASATGLAFRSWTGAAAAVPFSVGGQFDSALAWIDSSGNLFMGGGKLSKATAGDIIDTTTGTAWFYKGGGSKITFQPNNGSTVASFFASGSFNLVVNGGFQYGSGGADDSEAEWTDDLSIGAGDVVCWAEDDDTDGHGGRLVRCTHEDCSGAGVISTTPASLKGGAEIMVPIDITDEDGNPKTILEPERDPSPHWQPLALEGKVPAKVHGGDTSRLPINTRVVSAGDGTVRAWKRGDNWPLGIVVSRTSDVSGRALAPGCVLIMVR